MKKRILSTLLAGALTLSLAPAALAAEPGLANFGKVNTYAAGTFADVADAAWYAGSVQTAYELGLVNGTSETTFGPEGSITIGSALALACRLHSIYETGEGTFTQGDPWYQVYVDYAVANGIITAGQFSDYNANATRRQFAAILAKALPEEALEGTNSIPDNSIPDVAITAANAGDIYTLYRAGVLTGSDAAGTFAPETSIDRASVAAIVTRMADPSLRRELALTVAPAAVSLSKTSLTLSTGASETLTATVTPAEADQAVTWTSSNPSVATVENGKVTGKAVGAATITAATANGKTASCSVTVEKRALSTAPLYEDSNVKITFVRIEKSRYSTGEYELYLDVDNKTSSKLTVQCDAVSLNGYTFNSTVMSDDVSANSIGTVNTTIRANDTTLVDVNNVETLGGQFRIILGGVGSNSDTRTIRFNATNLYTGQTDNTVPAVTGKDLIYSDANVEFYYGYAEPARYSSDELEVYLLVRNKTSKTYTIQNDTITIDRRSYGRTIMSDPVLAYSTGYVNVTVREFTGSASSISSVGGDFRIIDSSNGSLRDTYTATMGNISNVGSDGGSGSGSGSGSTSTTTGGGVVSQAQIGLLNHSAGATDSSAVYPGFPDVPDFGAVYGVQADPDISSEGSYWYYFYVGPGGFSEADIANLRNQYLRLLSSKGFSSPTGTIVLDSGGSTDAFVKNTSDGRIMVNILGSAESDINFGMIVIGVSYF